ncbi:unnamed protein product [Nesidiocoris tenuis]|uniref:Uncharacterized protein n=1 Tax=Nesidiocoris tenuis TaxID=355587 RepID=A0A6H5FXQ7_9HEMI|nr:unnamed protein product [Nesidiocoris tenuis]
MTQLYSKWAATGKRICTRNGQNEKGKKSFLNSEAYEALGLRWNQETGSSPHRSYGIWTGLLYSNHMHMDFVPLPQISN